MEMSPWMTEVGLTLVGAITAWVIRVERKLTATATTGEMILRALTRVEDKVDRLVEGASTDGRG
jgi:hypothetical protein